MVMLYIVLMASLLCGLFKIQLLVLFLNGIGCHRNHGSFLVPSAPVGAQYARGFARNYRRALARRYAS